MALDFWQPWALLAALGVLAAAVVAGILLAGRKPRAAADAEHRALVSRAARLRALPAYRQALRRRSFLLVGLGVLAALAFASAAFVTARPQAEHVINPQNANRDIQLCLDVSGSMSDVVVETITVFEGMLEGFEGERIGLTIFNASPVQVFPLTDDYAFAKRELARIADSFDYNDTYPEHWAGTLNGPGASLIGDGLASCVMGFDHAGDERSRTVIVATDNDLQGASIVTVEQAAAFAKREGVRVYAINPADGLNEEQTAELAAAVKDTGGRAYALRDTTSVPEIIAEVQHQEAKVLTSEKKLVRADAPTVWLGLLAVLGLVWIIVAWRVRL